MAGFILYTAFAVFRAAAHELMETSLDPSLAQQVLAEAQQVPGVLGVTGLAGRMLGDVTLVEVHIEVDPDLPASAVGTVIDGIKRQLIAQVPGVAHVVMEPNSQEAEPLGLAALAAAEPHAAYSDAAGLGLRRYVVTDSGRVADRKSVTAAVASLRGGPAA